MFIKKTKGEKGFQNVNSGMHTIVSGWIDTLLVHKEEEWGSIPYEWLPSRILIQDGIKVTR